MSNLQLELLKLYAADVSEEDLLHIKRYLARYFAIKAIGEADDVDNQTPNDDADNY